MPGFYGYGLRLQEKGHAADRGAMGSLGMYLMIFGAASGVLSLFEYEFTLLSWIDSWGNAVAWFIRGWQPHSSRSRARSTRCPSRRNGPPAGPIGCG